MHGIVITLEVKFIQLDKRCQIYGAFMTCMELFGSGFRTDGIIIMKELLLMVVLGKMEIAPPV